MCRLIYVVLLLAALLVASEAQLTFSTDWGNGKRSARSEADGCGSEENIFAIYKLIQREAQKFLSCQAEGKN